MVRVVAAGHVNWDVTLRVESLPVPDGEALITDQHRSGGGSAANVATALVGYGADAGLIGAVGDDEPGFLARRELERDGVDVGGVLTVEGGETTVKYLVVDAEGQVMVLGNEGANEAVDRSTIDPAFVRAADHLHLTSQRPATAGYLVDLARETGVTVSFDPGRRVDRRRFDAIRDRVDVCFLNDREAGLAMPEGDPARSVAGTDRLLVVKHGASGATVYADGGTVEHPGYGVAPVDTTGAGDAFAAAFLAVLTGAWDGSPRPIAERDVERALAVANAAGALAACEEGAKTAPERDAVEAFLADRRPTTG